ncbi:MAG: methylated-DNA--[protein]-cysteine S-methyltransferase [Ruminiclostridium sp.]
MDIYFGGNVPDFTPPLNPKGTDFRRRVWEILLEIPYGKTITYGEIAEIIALKKGGGKMSAQAAGGAVGHNPVAIIIPCHRVIGSDGGLTGYRWGVSRKKALLDLEIASL